MKTVILVSVMILGGIQSSSWAAGYAIDVQGGRATGMAAAVTAFIDDAEAAYFNPAGLAQGRTLDVRVGATPILPSFSYQDPLGNSSSGIVRPVPPPHLYLSYGVTDELSVGLGVFSPYGLVVPWHSNWQGRFLSIQSDLKTYYTNPEVAYRIGDRVRLGAGIQIVRITAQLKRAINFVDSEGLVELAGATWGVGGNGGLQIEILPSVLSFGATYRSAVTSDINGRVHFSNIPIDFQSTAKDQNASTTVHLPATFSLGLAYQALPALKLAFNADYTGWQVFRRLALDFQDPSLSTVLPKNWSHTWNYHFGAEYTLNAQWRLRTGILIDPSPSPQDTITPELPDANRVNIALGAGYQWGHFAVDAGYQLVVITSVTSTSPQFPGTYSGVANLLSLTLGFHL